MFRHLTLVAVILALVVIVLGAYTRLTDAGLGCPDWPGCYGQLLAPTHSHEIEKAEMLFPHAPVESQKAWTEMIHRYFASTLGALILVLTGLAWFSKKTTPKEKGLTLTLLALVIFQGLLGMWTVTLKLFPLVVMSHLLGGLLTLSLLWSLWHQKKQRLPSHPSSPRPWVVIGFGLLFFQILLGGLTSANYAALSCPDFPGCTMSFFPTLDMQAFNLTGALALENPIQFLSLEARQTLHMLHRLGAMIVLLFLLPLIVSLVRFSKNLPFDQKGNVQSTSYLLMTLLGAQLVLGITNVVALLPLWVAVLHNFIAACLLLIMVRLFFLLPEKTPA